VRIDEDAGSWDLGEQSKQAGLRMVPTGPCFVTAPDGYIGFEEQLHSFERISLIVAIYPDTWQWMETDHYSEDDEIE
jgi:hypothetical protein